MYRKVVIVLKTWQNSLRFDIISIAVFRLTIKVCILPHEQPPLNLSVGTYSDLHTLAGLETLDAEFLAFAKAYDPDSVALLLSMRAKSSVDDVVYNYVILALAPVLERFLLMLFHVDTDRLAISYQDIAACMQLRKEFFLVVTKKHYQPECRLSFEQVHDWLGRVSGYDEADVAQYAQHIITISDVEAQQRLRLWCYYVTQDAHLFAPVVHWYAAWKPAKVTEMSVQAVKNADQTWSASQYQPLQRDHFALVDGAMSTEMVSVHNHYCVTCHNKKVDYCRSGFYQNKTRPEQGFRQDKHDETMHGCPIDQKISQMHWLKQKDFHLAALAAIMIDNPLCALTGHRICNDCMRSCIFQKQEPVDTPQVESRVLMDILQLPWGVEIYDLLIRWHPLRLTDYLPKADNQRKVAVMGLGPAGLGLIHHLSMQGCTVVGMDGAQIQPWPHEDVMQPVYQFSDINVPLEERAVLGFGGVSEYGITVRWNKNLLKLVYLSLLRRQRVSLLGNIRFGGSMTLDDCWTMGFDHVALALGAGLPKALDIPGSLAKGMRQANDFLMSLQLTGAYQQDTFAELSLHMPVVVIGGGLTAVDTATEAQAFYLQMTQLIQKRVRHLEHTMGKKNFWAAFSESESEKLRTWVTHGEAVIALRQAASNAGKDVDFTDLVSSWGGVSMVYRRAITQMRSYRQNAHELQSCLDQGIRLYTDCTPVRAVIGDDGSVAALLCLRRQLDINVDDFVIRTTRFDASGWLWAVDTAMVVSRGMVVAVTAAESTVCVYWKISHVDDAKKHWVLEPYQAQAGIEEQQVLAADVIRVQGVYTELRLPARAILVATGAVANVAYSYEYRDTLVRDSTYYATHALADDNTALLRCDETGADVRQIKGFFTNYDEAGKKVSFCGDLHPRYHGSVVKALASSQYATPHIMRAVMAQKPSSVLDGFDFVDAMCNRLHARCISLQVINKNYVYMKVHAPWLVQKALPGHLFKLSRVANAQYRDHDMTTQAVAVKLCGVDKLQNTLDFIFATDDVASLWLAATQPGERLHCMGPTGVRLGMANTASDYLIMSDAQGLGVACFYAQYLRIHGHRPKLFAVGIDDDLQAFYREWSVAFARDDTIVTRACTFAMAEYKDVYERSSHVCIQGGGDFVMRSYQSMQGAFKQHRPKIVGAVHGPMQCMLKGICAQCLQWQIDPETLERTKAVYACSWQDQPLEMVDLDHLQSRENACDLQKKLYGLWYGNDKYS